MKPGLHRKEPKNYYPLSDVKVFTAMKDGSLYVAGTEATLRDKIARKDPRVLKTPKRY